MLNSIHIWKNTTRINKYRQQFFCYQTWYSLQCLKYFATTLLPKINGIPVKTPVSSSDLLPTYCDCGRSLCKPPFNAPLRLLVTKQPQISLIDFDELFSIRLERLAYWPIPIARAPLNEKKLNANFFNKQVCFTFKICPLSILVHPFFSG